ncbi:phospholipase C, phosphocholine-specific (plasmid) [Pedobacter sp. BS3]|uniref:phosphocholine-specific phospholipase C n=1 Tax=Pedobacter sp. BS3 TaxID=2567937 RepID=UPI0011EF09F7|nr:phospholipase C, phosphocholine-specific [Pedobacter sp. BS3]TZF85511.1 phospholipase C, phosphocholine-specific [Pedobacter sp. BS3]
MSTRRDFIRQSLLLSGSIGLAEIMPASIARALAIDPQPGSSYLDAEHVVILMQENRSFDHCFGTLQGVRGFNDPRAVTLPDNKPVWLQTNAAGKVYTPFRLNIKDTKATWMGALPHARASQVDANNLGRFDQWLNAKRSKNKKYEDMPLTMGYYTREDLPFNYALADAFTVCDQNFCSAMTSTYPNRLYLWTGTIREQQNGSSKAHIRNEDLSFSKSTWRTFPELLEENNIPWKVYQNDVSCGGGYQGEERTWLSNFGCNPLEYFSQYHVKFSARYIGNLQLQAERLPGEIKELQEKAQTLATGGDAFKKVQTAIQKKQTVLENVRKGLARWRKDNYEKLSEKEKSLYNRAFTRNDSDPFYQQLTTLQYTDEGKQREVTVPKGDILYQFRKDVDTGNLPTVSWLVAPQGFSDHPSAPWYGAWYVSEVLDILTKNPEVWKKTIFILTYDENDGYFDHVPPFLPPDPLKSNTGKCSPGTDTAVEHIRLQQELEQGLPDKQAREAPIGLGFRVPLIVASPWSRGGQVCSQVFDHTSVLQFLEGFLSQKYGKKIEENNISLWRRTICGDLTSVFRPFIKEQTRLPYLSRDGYIEKIHKAQFKKEPDSYKALSTLEVERAKKAGYQLLAVQEKGIRPACALPYQLYADCRLSKDKKYVELNMEAGNQVFGRKAAGAPFTVYIPDISAKKAADELANWHYAVKAGDSLTDSWELDLFPQKHYHLKVYGPNGFFREFSGDANEPPVEIRCAYEFDASARKLTGNVMIALVNPDPSAEYAITVIDHIRKNNISTAKLPANGRKNVVLDLSSSFCWYDFTVKIDGFKQFENRYAGKVETGEPGYTDPVMGNYI